MSPATVSVARCVLCGSEASIPLVADARDRQFGLPGEFALRRCRACGLVRLSPRPAPEALAGYYPEVDYPAFAPSGQQRRRLLTWARDAGRDLALTWFGYPAPRATRGLDGRWLPGPVRRRAAYGWRGFPRHVAGGRALDVGCGNGAFLACLQRHGWQTLGVDTSPAAARSAAERGVTVRVGEIESVDLTPARFDFVHMSHVIEHASDPLVTLRRVRELLAPGGTVYLETPNVDSLGFRLAGSYWFPLEVPRHLWLFSPATLSRTLAACGFRIPEVHGVPMRTGAWTATYRREERTGIRSDPRPALARRERPRALLADAAAVLAARRWPARADVIACWAQAR